MHKSTLKEKRQELKKTQAEIAEIMGVTISAVSAWETNKADMPARQFIKLCNVYNVSRDDIYLPEISN